MFESFFFRSRVVRERIPKEASLECNRGATGRIKTECVFVDLRCVAVDA